MKIRFIFLVVLLAAGPAFSQGMGNEFSAEMVSYMQGQNFSAKLYVAKDKARTEMPGVITIIRSDKKVSWTLVPEQHMYIEQALDFSRVPMTNKDMPGETERISMGTEVINGQPAEKFRVTYRQGGKTTSVYQWIKDGDIPVRTEGLDGSWWVEYRNVVMGPPPAHLFEPPPGYQKMQLPELDVGNMLKGMIK